MSSTTPILTDDATLQHDLDELLNFESITNVSRPHSGIDFAGPNDVISGNREDFDAEDYANFSQWIPSFVKPDEPCEYCRNKGLECYMKFGTITCKACDSLFRPCSFARVRSREPNAAESLGALDTLHIVEEDVCTEQGALTGRRQLRSKAGDAHLDDKRSATRFSKAAVKTLRDWFEAHIDHPYPTESEKLELEQSTGLKYNQITTWLANTRRRSSRSIRSTKRGASPAPMSRSPAIDVPAPAVTKEWQDLNPFERWQHSPPENEPAPLDAIADAVKHVDFLRPTTSSSASRRANGSSSAASRSAKRANSTTSMETGRESATSNSKSHSSIAWSHGSTHSSLGSLNSFGSGLHGKRDRRRKRKTRAGPIGRDPADEKSRIFQCTFCCDTFKTKYDWTRHEKTLHLSLEKWICAPIGPVVTDTQTGKKTCVYCGAADPTKEHISTHNHEECEAKGFEARTFYRKDHLRQHLRLMHHCELLPFMESWKASADVINCRCGFCAERFKSWSARNDHIAAHYRNGAHIKDWKSCRGFDPEVAANVTNAMPPYLIGMERLTPQPFSASAPKLLHSQKPLPGACLQDPEGIPKGALKRPATRPIDKTTCWEILTVSLGRFVKEMSDKGIAVTDAMLQEQGRRSIYGDADDWNQTAADNPEWLDLFKKAHGLGIIPEQIGGVGQVIPDDVELYVDLGLRIPFSVQQEQLNRNGESPPELSPEPPHSKQFLYPAMIGSDGEPRPARHYLGYSDIPIPAERAAHFATWTSTNPLIQPCQSRTNLPKHVFEPGTDLFHLAREGNLVSTSGSLSPEQELAWQRTVEQDRKALNKSSAAAGETGGLGMDFSAMDASAMMQLCHDGHTMAGISTGSGHGDERDDSRSTSISHSNAARSADASLTPSSFQAFQSPAAAQEGTTGLDPLFDWSAAQDQDFNPSDFLTNEALDAMDGVVTAEEGKTGLMTGATAAAAPASKGVVDFSSLLGADDPLLASEEFDFGDVLGL